MGKNTIICSLLLLIMMVVQGAALAVPDVIRLHVIANSDSTQDQYIKELVRDRIVADLGPVFAELDQNQVEQWILDNNDVLDNLATGVLVDAGCYQGVQVSFGVEEYPTRAYGPVVYPAGNYKSLRIILGAGEGRNWWCLMFPPLCFVEETIEQPEGDDNQPGDIKVRFWLLDKFTGLMRRLGIKND